MFKVNLEKLRNRIGDSQLERLGFSRPERLALQYDKDMDRMTIAQLRDLMQKIEETEGIDLPKDIRDIFSF